MKLRDFFNRLFAPGPNAKDLKDRNTVLLREVESSLSTVTDLSAVSMKRLLENVPDEFYLWLLTEGHDDIKSSTLKSLLPTMPDEQTQATFTGKTGNVALKQAYGTYKLFKDIATDYSIGLDGGRNVLDFGCGWGRIIRFFQKDVEPSGLYGVDANENVIGICKQTNMFANFEHINPMPPTRFPDSMFDVVYLYSVFSHLSEEACNKWLAEFQRILKPGGIIIATTRPRSFIAYCGKLRASKDIVSHGLGAAKAFPDTEQVLSDYDSGKFCFSPGSSSVLDESMYGESAIPRKYVEENWTKYFSRVGFIYEYEHKKFDQNVIIAQKEKKPKADGPVIVYNMGKVGSRSVYETLVDLDLGVEVHHAHVLHDLDRMAGAIKKQFANPVNSLAVIEQGKRLRMSIEADPGLRWNIITLVRDPLAQTVSRFFQSIEEVIPDAQKRLNKGTLRKDDIFDAFMQWPRHPALVWFDNQFKTVFGIDVFSKPFPTEKGYDIIRAGRFSVLIIRLEDLDSCAESALNEFFGIPGLKLKKTNVGADKWYKDIYRQLVSDIVLPDEYLAEMYGSKLASHFYTQAEIDGFRAKWTRRGGGE